MSFAEAVINTGVGYLLAVGTQLAIFPLFALPARLNDAMAMGVVFTFVSVGRSYALRRLFERWRHEGA
ncbi:MAG: hypothetical protein WA418_41500 [Bradyrhizobium sp.]